MCLISTIVNTASSAQEWMQTRKRPASGPRSTILNSSNSAASSLSNSRSAGFRTRSVQLTFEHKMLLITKNEQSQSEPLPPSDLCPSSLTSRPPSVPKQTVEVCRPKRAGVLEAGVPILRPALPMRRVPGPAGPARLLPVLLSCRRSPCSAVWRAPQGRHRNRRTRRRTCQGPL